MKIKKRERERERERERGLHNMRNNERGIEREGGKRDIDG